MADPATRDKDTVEAWSGLEWRDGTPDLRRSGPTDSSAREDALDAVTSDP
jgi:hypothetical protein